jgi:outer membrane protein assembly factor BamE (lipoprotein component of BamABCDE complex)
MTKTDMKRTTQRQDRLLHSSCIRHSSLVILATGLLLAAMLVLNGCVGRRITKANVDEVAENMSKKQVESILGPPTELDNKDFLILKKTTYVYRQGNDTVTIVFKDDKVVEKQSTLTH